MGENLKKKWITCADPFSQHKSKIKKNKSFLKVEKEYARTFEKCVPQLLQKLQHGDVWICSICIWRIKRSHQNCVEPVAELANLSLAEPQSEFETTQDSDFEDISTEKEVLSKKLLSFGIDGSFLKNKYVTSKDVLSCVAAIDEYFTSLKARLANATGVQIQDQTEDKSQVSSTSNCPSCKTLITELGKRFKEVTTKDDKYRILTCLPNVLTLEDITRIFECTMHMARKSTELKNTVGFYSCPSLRVGRKLPQERVELIKNFYESDENSWADPSTRAAKLGKKANLNAVDQREADGQRENHGRRHILMSLADLYTLFQDKYPEEKISISAFAKLRPDYCIFPGQKGFHLSCTIVTHENFDLQLAALNVNMTMSQAILCLICDSNNANCSLGSCNRCPKMEVINSWFDDFPYTEITLNMWGNVEGQFGTNLYEKTESLEDFKNRFYSSLLELLPHHFIMKKQFQFIEELKSKILLSGDNAIFQVDFSQNYNCVIQKAVQGFHWSSNQVTIHPFVVTWFEVTSKELKTKSFVVVSNYLIHDAEAFHAFRTNVLRHCALDGLKFQNIFYISDGAGSQYKNKKNFANLLHHYSDFGINAQWDFFPSAHGKGPCDGIGAVVKKVCTTSSLKIDPATKKQIYIRNAEDVATFAGKMLNNNKVKIIYVSADEIVSQNQSQKLRTRYDNVKTIPGTRIYHSFIPSGKSTFHIRRYSLSQDFKIVKLLKTAPANEQKYFVNDFVGIRLGSIFSIGIIVGFESDLYNCELLTREGASNVFVRNEFQNSKEFGHDEIIRAIKHLDCDPITLKYKLRKNDLKALESGCK